MTGFPGRWTIWIHISDAFVFPALCWASPQIKWVWRKSLCYQNLSSSEVKSKRLLLVIEKAEPGVKSKNLHSPPDICWVRWGLHLLTWKIKSWRRLLILLVLMVQERVSPSGLHKHSMWFGEETASQEYLKKLKPWSKMKSKQASSQASVLSSDFLRGFMGKTVVSHSYCSLSGPRKSLDINREYLEGT